MGIDGYGLVGGVDRGAYSRHNPWHHASNTENKLISLDRTLTVQEAIEYTFPWTVQETKLHDVLATLDENFNWVAPPGADEHKILQRSDNGFVLDVVSSSYGVVQPQVLGELGEAAQMADASFGTGNNKLNCFSLHNGKVNVLYLERDEPSVLGGGDVVMQRGLALITSHNSTYALAAKPVSWVVECMNTMPTSRHISISSVRHTKGAMDYVPAMKQAIVDAYANWAHLDAEVEQLLSTPMLKSEFTNVVKALLPEPKDDDRSQAAYDRKFEAIVGQWGATGQQAAIGTAWGSLMAINSYELWVQRTKGDRTTKQINRFLDNDFPLTKKAQSMLVSA